MIRPKFIVSALSGLALVIAVTFLAPVVVEKVVAQTGSKAVSGYAWSSNIGWIQMETGSSPVVVNSDGSFSGYGWSSNVGWLQFNPAGPYPAAPSHGVKIDLTTNTMSGWGRFLANGGGWDGWVNFDGVTYDPVGKKFAGYAWGADVVGWVDMSHVLADLTTTVTPDPCADADPSNDPAGGCGPTGCTPGVDCKCGDPQYTGDCGPTKFKLEVKVIGAGTVSGDPISSCRDVGGSGCVAQITSGDSISLVATADLTDPPATITWAGDVDPSCSNTNCSVTMNNNRSITVNFSSAIVKPSPFTINYATCSQKVVRGGKLVCRMIMNCTVSGKEGGGCSTPGHLSTAAIEISKESSLSAISLLLVPSLPVDYLSYVLCSSPTGDDSQCQISPDNITGDKVYLRMKLIQRQQGIVLPTSLNISSPETADHSAKTEKIEVEYNDSVSGS